MRRWVLVWLLVAGGGGWWLAEAVTRDDFLLQTTQDLVDVCAVPPGAPAYEGALGFCYGYGVGAFHYYAELAAGSPEDAFLCLPVPMPARAEVMAWFVAWARAHPGALTARPVDGLFQFLQATWPCRR